jgi:hypothetical protein
MIVAGELSFRHRHHYFSSNIEAERAGTVTTPEDSRSSCTAGETNIHRG